MLRIVVLEGGPTATWGGLAGATLPLVGVKMCLGMFIDVCACCHLFVLHTFVKGVGVCLGRCEARETNNLKVEREKLIIEGREIDNRRPREKD